MATISPDRNHCTLIHVFHVSPDKARALLDLLKVGTEEVMSHLPGYVSANMHLSLDHKTVTNYVKWESFEAFDNMQQHPESRRIMQAAAQIAESSEPVLYGEIWSDASPQYH